MRYAIFGDIHANLEALDAVLNDAAENGCNGYVCLGDIVGYNANPSECLEKVKELGCAVIKGNHDEDCIRENPMKDTNPIAREAQRWTYEQLSPEQREWLKDLRYVRQVFDFTIVHSSLDQPQQMHYIINKFDAMASMAYQFTRLCFIAHTHIPQIYTKTDVVEPFEGSEIVLENGVKYLVNPGSVGQPRDGDWRASYAIFDLRSGTISLRRVEYDIATAQQKIKEAGLPDFLAQRLAEGV